MSKLSLLICLSVVVCTYTRQAGSVGQKITNLSNQSVRAVVAYSDGTTKEMVIGSSEVAPVDFSGGAKFATEVRIHGKDGEQVAQHSNPTSNLVLTHGHNVQTGKKGIRISADQSFGAVRKLPVR